MGTSLARGGQTSLWQPGGLISLLAQSGTIHSHTGDTNETQLHAVTIPPVMRENDILRIIPFWRMTDSANDKTIKVYFGGGIGVGTVVSSNLFTTSELLQPIIMIRANNSRAAQKAFSPGVQSGIGATGNSMLTLAIDMTLEQTIAFTGQLETAGEAIHLEGYSVELLRAP